MTRPECAAAAARIRHALEAAADALASADLDGLLRSEEGLELAVRDLKSLRSLSAEERAALRPQAEGIRSALARCRVLGDSMRDIIRIGLEAQGRVPSYGRREGDYAPRSVEARG